MNKIGNSKVDGREHDCKGQSHINVSDYSIESILSGDRAILDDLQMKVKEELSYRRGEMDSLIRRLENRGGTGKEMLLLIED